MPRVIWSSWWSSVNRPAKRPPHIVGPIRNDDPYTVRLDRHVRACHKNGIDLNCPACKALKGKCGTQQTSNS